MTANAAIYTAAAEAIPVKNLQNLVGNGQIQVSKGTPSQIQIKWADLSITMNMMEKNEIPRHVQGLAGYAIQLIGDSRASQAKAVLQRIQNTQQAIGIMIEPGWDTQERCKQLILGLTEYYHGYFFAGNSIYDEGGVLIIGVSGARKHFFPDKTPTHTNMARKERSERILQNEGVPISRTLPPIVDETGTQLRSKEVVARRAICLCLIAVLGESGHHETFEHLVHLYGVESDFTPSERAFITYPKPDERIRAQFTWRYESYWVLLWSLGFVDKLDRPNHIIDVARAATILKDYERAAFIHKANLRPVVEILDQLDLIYRYHWAVVDARLKQQPPPANLELGVIYERHYALNWLTNYGQADWDDVEVDT